MTAALVLLLGVTAALFPAGGRPAAWRGAGGRLGVAQVVVLVLGALLGAPVLGLPWWQAPAAAGLAGLWTAPTPLAPPPRATLRRRGAGARRGGGGGGGGGGVARRDPAGPRSSRDSLALGRGNRGDRPVRGASG